MALGKLPLIRYLAIDECLKNKSRTWTLKDLIKACSEKIFDHTGISRQVSIRTVREDLRIMRSKMLGYNAPIKVVGNKFYTYEQDNYSITNIPLSTQDFQTLSEVVDVLKQFKGFGYFTELNTMVNKLESKIFQHQHNGRTYINFEKNDQLKGLEFIDLVHKAIIKKSTLTIDYQSFKTNKPSIILFYPYLLKEYRNRWFILGANKELKIITLALDRVSSVRVDRNARYIENTEIEIDTYYDDLIGVSKTLTQEARRIVLKVDKEQAPYILTKPLHKSQKMIKEEKDGVTFSINVIWNYELEREIMGFGESIEVLSPANLRKKIFDRIHTSIQIYQKKVV